MAVLQATYWIALRSILVFALINDAHTILRKHSIPCLTLITDTSLILAAFAMFGTFHTEAILEVLSIRATFFRLNTLRSCVNQPINTTAVVTIKSVRLVSALVAGGPKIVTQGTILPTILTFNVPIKVLALNTSFLYRLAARTSVLSIFRAFTVA